MFADVPLFADVGASRNLAAVNGKLQVQIVEAIFRVPVVLLDARL